MRKKIKYPLIIINTHLSAPLKIVKMRAFNVIYNQGNLGYAILSYLKKGNFVHLLKLYILSIH